MRISVNSHCIKLTVRAFVQQADVRTQTMMQRWIVLAPAVGLRT
jgi:hypothetical protein